MLQMRGSLVVLLGIPSILAVFEGLTDTGTCVAPGTCVPPPAKHSVRVIGPEPGQQWNINGGFCGAWSTQQCALAAGAWISQDLVRKANRLQNISHAMHGNDVLGYEVMPSNVAYTAQKLKLSYDEWDYTKKAPQAPEYLKWLKSHLVRAHPVVWFPLCKGDGHECYADSCPNNGACDHVEPMFAIFSNRSLDDEQVYDDDVVLHASDQDQMPYYRKLSSLADSTAMDANCKNAQAGFGKNEMYPCFDQDVTYGLAVQGLAVTGSLPVSLEVDTRKEPNIRAPLTKPAALHGRVTVQNVKVGQQYTLFRFNSTYSLPAQPPFAPTAQYATDFVADDVTWVYEDPITFESDTAVYYLAA